MCPSNSPVFLPSCAVLHFESRYFPFSVQHSPDIYLLRSGVGGTGPRLGVGGGEERADPGQDQLLYFIFDKVIKAVVTC